MSKTKNKGRSEVEHLNGLVRQLKKHVKKLTKDNNQLRKQLNRAEIDEPAELYEEEESTSEAKCPICKSVLNCVDLGTRSLIACKECSYRKVIENE